MPQPGPAPAPHRFYYLHNFQRALDWLHTRYGDLLGVDDLQFLTDFRQLPQAAQALLVRMVMRRGPWFRASKLAYDEIPDTRDAAAPLLSRGWLCADAPLGLSELFALHTKRELLQILQGTALHPTMRKAEMLQALADRADLRQPYAASRAPGARHRQIRVLERMQCSDQALALAHQALAAPESEEEHQRVARMLPRLRRSLGQGGGPRRPALAPAVAALRMDVELPAPTPPQSVEHALRAHWHCAEAPVFYVENTLVNALFGLLCWPAIFAPLPGAFFHPFQSGPADLAAPDFVARRQALFNACLAELHDGRYRATILQRFEEKHGTQSPFVAWGALSAELLALALDCIPPAHLERLFARLLRDVQANRTGLPDLVRFWPGRPPGAERYALVEVKAPGDKLQDNQIRWLDYCVAQGIPVQVCHVQWCGPA